MTLNTLETSVLKWIKQKYSDPILAQQLDNLEVLGKKSTGCGFFIDFSLSKSVPPLSKEVFPERAITGPFIKSSGVELDGGSILFVEDGRVATLELYANGEFFKDDITELYDKASA